ncbi:Unknown protein sequence [Pseudomonas syringae pv. cilantro]|uniref:Uncharacterized protein n=1 Tax=Pseudomonas syringae pv. cilantro TaxID=81035 RepID=A0A0N0X9D5_PSESX|nr:Unknown protein sequence [Pseudomonas syringae pv. cilantro]
MSRLHPKHLRHLAQPWQLFIAATLSGFMYKNFNNAYT